MCMRQALWMSDHSNRVPNDRGSCTEEPDERESLTSGFEVAVGAERPLLTITVMQRTSVSQTVNEHGGVGDADHTATV